MKKDDNFRAICECCATCRNSYYFDLGFLYADTSAIMHKMDGRPKVYYCNADGTCPAKTQEEFIARGEDGEFDENSPDAKWLGLTNETVDMPELSPRFVGNGLGVCDKYEPTDDALELTPGKDYDVYYYVRYTVEEINKYDFLLRRYKVTVRAPDKRCACKMVSFLVQRRCGRHAYGLLSCTHGKKPSNSFYFDAVVGFPDKVEK